MTLKKVNQEEDNSKLKAIDRWATEEEQEAAEEAEEDNFDSL